MGKKLALPEDRPRHDRRKKRDKEQHAPKRFGLCSFSSIPTASITIHRVGQPLKGVKGKTYRKKNIRHRQVRRFKSGKPEQCLQIENKKFVIFEKRQQRHMQANIHSENPPPTAVASRFVLPDPPAARHGDQADSRPIQRGHRQQERNKHPARPGVKKQIGAKQHSLSRPRPILYGPTRRQHDEKKNGEVQRDKIHPNLIAPRAREKSGVAREVFDRCRQYVHNSKLIYFIG